MKDQVSDIVASTSDAKPITSPVVIDLGKKRRSRIRDLRKGRSGKLLDEVSEAIDLLRANGSVASEAQPIIVVVRERSRKRGWGRL